MLDENKYKGWIWSIFVILIAISIYGLSKVTYTESLESFLPDLETQEVTWGNEKNVQVKKNTELLILGISSKTQLTTYENFEKINDLIEDVNKLEGVQKALSPFNTYFFKSTYFTPVKRYFFDPKGGEEQFYKDTSLFFQYQDIFSKFISDDKKSICVYIHTDTVYASDFTDQVANLVKAHSYDNYYFHGVHANNFSVGNIRNRMLFFGVLSFVTICVVFFIVFKSWRLVLVAIIFLIVTNLITLGTMGLTGISINALTFMVPCIVSVVSVSDIVHVFWVLKSSSYGGSYKSYVRNVYRQVGFSLFLTSITTLIGFLSLSISSLKPFIQFGCITSFGILIALVLINYWLPQVLYFLEPKRWKNDSNTQQLIWTRLSKFCFKYKVVNTVFSVALLFVAIFFLSKTKIDSYLLEDFGTDSPAYKTNRFFETNFFGVRDTELIIDIYSSDGIWNLEVIKELDHLEEYLNEEYGVKYLVSFNTTIKQFNRFHNAGLPFYYKIPESNGQLERIKKSLEKYSKLSDQSNWVSYNGKQVRIRLNNKDLGSYVAKEHREKLKKFIVNNINQELISVRFSGRSLAVDQANKQIVYHLFYSLFGAVIFVFLIVLIVYKSFRVAFITLFVNVLPLFVLCMFLYVFNIPLNKTTAVVFTIAFGIAVDDTIHFISRYMKEVKKEKNIGLTNINHIENTYKQTGSPILITSLLLILGFGLVIFSGLKAAMIIGGLVSLSLLLATWSDLIILPSLLSYNKLRKK